jgi:hypothetical protein
MIRHLARRERGAALMLFATVLILGVAWFTVGALGKAAPTTAQREVQTANALRAAKRALLDYAAQYAARTDHDVPGRLPCPELLSSVGTANEGEAASSCSNSTLEIGRLPWKTLGVERIADGYGEPLWYVLSPGFRQSPINFASTGQIMLDGAPNAAVALIIAPGVALNTLSDSDPPPAGCAKRNQGGNRFTSPLNPLDFLECGNATGPNFVSPVSITTSKWFNDRVIAVTTAELMETIAGAVADRLQRTVAPLLADWDAAEFAARGKSWGRTHGISFLPFASTFGNPAANDYCGDAGIREGLAPLALQAGGCTNSWSGAVSLVSGLLSLGCFDADTYLSCSLINLFGTPPFSARVTATAPRIASSFRSTIRASDIVVTGGGSASLSVSVSPATGNATATVDATWPPGLPLFAFVEVRVPHVQDAVALSDARISWFRNNNWHHFTYYAVSPSATVGSTAPCTTMGDPGCLEVRGLAASTGSYWNKRLALVLAGPSLAGQSRLCTDTRDANGNPVPDGIPDCAQVVNYLEEENRTTLDRVFRADLRIANPSAPAPPHPPFNDRVATCPLLHTLASGSIVEICN